MSAHVYSWAEAVEKQCRLKDDEAMTKFLLVQARLKRVMINDEIKTLENKLIKIREGLIHD